MSYRINTFISLPWLPLREGSAGGQKGGQKGPIELSPSLEVEAVRDGLNRASETVAFVSGVSRCTGWRWTASGGTHLVRKGGALCRPGRGSNAPNFGRRGVSDPPIARVL
jgi:hypothetical protein